MLLALSEPCVTCKHLVADMNSVVEFWVTTRENVHVRNYVNFITLFHEKNLIHDMLWQHVVIIMLVLARSLKVYFIVYLCWYSRKHCDTMAHDYVSDLSHPPVATLWALSLNVFTLMHYTHTAREFGTGWVQCQCQASQSLTGCQAMWAQAIRKQHCEGGAVAEY